MRAALLAAVLAAPAAAVSPDVPAPLVSYSFDEPVDTGPDTFAIFQHSQGTVRRAASPRLSGHHSLEIKDVPGDGTFPELQGYFALRRHGRLYAHFAFLTTDPTQNLNIALAGPAHFTIRKDGIAFWLAVKNGWLVHYPATRVVGRVPLAGVGECVPTPLVAVEPFLWYVADLAYDIDGGTYDLTIRKEGASEPVVHLTRQRNSAARPGSSLDKFSFIGDLEDQSAVTYYVDDVVIGVDGRIAQLPFVAPGRRRLFVDRFADAEREMRERSCLPVQEAADFGLDGFEIETLRRAGGLEVLSALSAGRVVPLPAAVVSALREDTRRRLEAAARWARGCDVLASDPAGALDEFRRGQALAPEATMLAAGVVTAAARVGRWTEVDENLRGLAWSWRDDPRYGVLLAVVGTSRGGLDDAEAWLRAPAESVSEAPPLVAATYYYVLVAKGEHALAQDYAQRVADRVAAREGPAPASAEWLERAGDAALRMQRLDEAKQLYEKARGLAGGTGWVLLKLSDLAWLQGDLVRERAYREAIYGRLQEAR